MAASAFPAEPAAPTEKARPQPAEKDSRTKPTDRQAPPFDDPLAREKLQKDLWITKGVQGGFKTGDLWIMQTPNPGNTSRENGDAPKATNPSANWAAVPGSSPNRTQELTAEERMRLIKEWERFVFGEPKKDGERRNTADDLWRQPPARTDERSYAPATSAGKYPEKTAEPPVSLNLRDVPSTPNSPQIKRETGGSDVRFSPFGSQEVPGLRPETWNPTATRNQKTSAFGTLPQMPTMALPGNDPTAPVSPNTQPFAPFGPNMNFGSPLNNPNMPGAPQGPVPSPRAHSTDSFIPRQW